MSIPLAGLTAPASNKPSAVSATHHPEGYTAAYTISTANGTVDATQPIIDKLTLTLSVNAERAAAIKDVLVNSNNHETYLPALKFPMGTSRYRLSRHLIHAPSGQRILLQADPFSERASFLRFEMNPALLGQAGVCFCREHLMNLIGQPDWSAIAAKANLTRIDLACDLVNVRIDALALKAAAKGKTHSYFGMKGRLETTYMAVKAGKNGEIAVYNKKRELKNAGSEPWYGDLDHTRVEVHVPTRRTLDALTKIDNPFTKVAVSYLAPTVPDLADHEWGHFCDSIRYRGLDGALELVPVDLRGPYLHGLSQPEPIWQPEMIWSKWPHVLASSGLLGASY